MLTSPKKCKYLVVRNNVGVCKKLNSICTCYDCEYNYRCEWFSECAKLDWEKAEGAEALYLIASRKIRDTIRNKIREIPSRELCGGLLYRREDSLISAFTVAQGDIVDALLIQKYLKNLPELSSSDIKPSSKTTELCNLITFSFIFDSFRRKILNKDMNIFATKEGKETLSKLVDNPLEYVTKIYDQMGNMFRERSNNGECISAQEIKPLWSLKMFDSYSWCKSNNMPIELTSIRNDKDLERIKNHMAEIGERTKEGKKIVLDKKVCFDLSFNLYSSLIAVCRFIYTNFKPVRDAISVIRPVSQSPRLAFSSLKIEDWDGLVMEAHLRSLSNDLTFDYPMPMLPQWPLHISDGTFWASTLLMAFIESNFEEIVLDRLEKGWVFEEKVRNELINRDVQIIKKNLETPYGEVDFICRKLTNLYAIEAKDYGPWYRDWYVSGKAFKSRNTALKRRLSNFIKRVEWINSSLEKVGLGQRVKPLLVSNFQENVIVNCLKLQDLDKFFGPSKFPKYKQTLPKIKVTQSSFDIEIMGRCIHNPQILKLQGPNGAELIGRQCPIHPECICVFIEDNPWLRQPGKMRNFCKRLQTTFNGGPCPNFTAFCMWAAFCRSSIDPAPYVKKLMDFINSVEKTE